MQASRHRALMPILHDDLLWDIFLLNTHPDFTYHDSDFPVIESGYRPLTTARHCSQVCRQWRSIYLSSPSIWGRLIYLDSLQQQKDDWWKEVVARTGEASLWVYGEAWPRNMLDFPFPFLQKNWRRVQRLFITDNSNSGSITLSPLDRQKMWAFLKEPAPRLESIRICMSGSVTTLPVCQLSDDCPLLRSFGIFDGTYKFPINTSWLRNLSSVAFPHSCTTEEILNALRRMPELVCVTISNFAGTDSEISNHQGYPQIILPKLRMLALRGNLRTAGIVLQCIKPSADCCITITRLLNVRVPGGDHLEEYEQYEKGLTSHVMSYFSQHPPSAIKLHFKAHQRDILSLESHPATRSAGLDYYDLQRFAIELYSPSSSLLQKLIASASFSRVTTLRVIPSFIIRTPAPDMVSILEPFTSLTTFSTEDGILRSLLKYPERTAALFPTLVTLEVTRRWREKPTQQIGVLAHEKFLKLRKEIGRPISILDLGSVLKLQRDRNHFEFEHPGLLVKWSRMIDGEWRTEEYRCGDGHPEKLRFSSVVEILEAEQS
ncbi:hypothetical protein D9613_010847 [Agrocybe pediades]|uniref:F-box domain-containing protein n=1 Tax=Agrocybe pediades TaxID=84607 RepID=A0A8H4VMC1_9AGAR|nr:hypothetical protein D9613_010847 [Agrocybe pediades]